MNKLRTVLSLFDGMSVGQIALKQIGLSPEKYYASEIDKFAIMQTQHNFPDTIQLGDITKWQSWDIDFTKIDLILAGSPCQGFSFAGKILAFDDPRSKLFFVFIDILNHVRKFNPNVKFLLENVAMKKIHEKVITEYCGVYPVVIDSALVSAQSRVRLYWSNISTKKVGLFGELHTNISQPKDKHIYIDDIIEHNVNIKYYMPKNILKKVIKKNRLNILKKVDFICIGIRRHNAGDPQRVEVRYDRKTNCLTTSGRDNYIVHRPIANYGGQKSNCIRILTPTESSKLQTIPDWYDWICSDTQIYKMLGNGWTCEIIMHILNYLKK